MKQKKFGKKVINWHRQFQSSQLSNQFLRRRRDDLEYTEQGKPLVIK